MKNNKRKNILICPLNWGAGHATRVQVIAWELRKRGYKIYIAAPRSLHETFDKAVYDELITLRSPSVYYPGFTPLYIAVMFQMPVLLVAFFADRLRLPGIIRKYGIDLIISDNRFGLWSRGAYSIYITHQLRVALPRGLGFVETLVSAVHRSVAGRYDECWVPDFPGENNLSGMLSHDCRMPSNTKYIGPLSRFYKLDVPIKNRPLGGGVHDFGFLPSQFTLALLSGPEPQRTIFENIITLQKDKLPGKLIIVAGTPGDNKQTADDDILRYSWLDGAALKQLMEQADLIICRSGYSTIMDLFYTGKTSLLVPTPGQPEQEYLACYLAERYNFTTITQRQLARHGDIPAVNDNIQWPGIDKNLLDKALDQLLRKLP